jgi:hypothetical protein
MGKSVPKINFRYPVDQAVGGAKIPGLARLKQYLRNPQQNTVLSK